MFNEHSKMELKRSVRLQLSDKKLHYSYEGQVYNVQKGGVRQKKYISVADGETSMNLHWLIGGDQTDYPRSGFIKEEPVHWDYNNRGLSPILMYCRPCEESLGGTNLASVELASEPELVGERTCLVLRSCESYQKSFWVDPSRGFIVMRITRGKSGFPPLHRIDISYRQTDDDTWFPHSWKLIVTAGSATKVRSQQTARVTSIEFNPDIPDSESRLEYPSNTAIVDQRSGGRFITRKDGSRRVVTDEELARGAKYQNLVDRNSDRSASVRSEGK